ncbi:MULTISPECIES: signal peptidase I [unclassified Adlercreutzia]|uniref:signal peptidase I n=1 Tax=unclassified Adlercreutzia TaxID=2636013 RepID=UPI0013EB8F88|nr:MULTISPECIES: signal peptidase I [unclassified Adlercreutzia]
MARAKQDSAKLHGQGEAPRAERAGEKQPSSLRHKVGTVIGIVLCVILLPILAINVTLIIRSFIAPDEVPSVGGVFPLIVLTDSMYPEIQSGDLIICHAVEPEEVQVGDTIAFFDPAGNGTSIVSHSVTEVVKGEGGVSWITRGIANNADDATPVPADKLVGVYQMRLPGLGNVVMFMQTPAGLVLCVVCPIILLVGWDVFRRRQYEKRMRAETSLLQSELEQLRAQQNSLLREETM